MPAKLARRQRVPQPALSVPKRETISPALLATVLVPLTFLLTGCEAVKAIFKAGVWVGVLSVFAVLALIVFVAGKLLKK